MTILKKLVYTVKKYLQMNKTKRNVFEAITQM